MRSFLLPLWVLVALAPPTAAPAWQTHISDGGFAGYDGEAYAVAFDTAGNVVAGGRTHWSGDHGAATVAKVSFTGELLWRTRVDPVGATHSDAISTATKTPDVPVILRRTKVGVIGVPSPPSRAASGS